MSAGGGAGPFSRGFPKRKASRPVLQASAKGLLPRNSNKAPDEAFSRPNGDSKLFDGSRLWAVLIGVNTYPYDKNLPTLLGAVTDALSMHEYLTNDLRVPSCNIRLITEGETNPPPSGPPTRDNILNALYDHLRDNESVKRHDNILIYFAGHGSSYHALGVSGNRDEDAGSIEAICPADRGRHVGADVIPDISDREINIFLSELCREKGTKITVIHDCCYSGGMARGLVQAELPPRFGEPLPDPPHCSQVEILLTAADTDPRRKSWSQKAFSGAYEPDDSTCVHLAACGDYEHAHEFPDSSGAVHGVFTQRLLSELRASTDKTTYLDLQNNLQGLKLQQPQVVGNRVQSKLWYSEDLRTVQQDASSDVRATAFNPRQRSFEYLPNSEEIGAHNAYAASEKRADRSNTASSSQSQHGQNASFTLHDTNSSPVFLASNGSELSLALGNAQSDHIMESSLPNLRLQEISSKRPEAERITKGKSFRNPRHAKWKGHHEDGEATLYSRIKRHILSRFR